MWFPYAPPKCISAINQIDTISWKGFMLGPSVCLDRRSDKELLQRCGFLRYHGSRYLFQPCRTHTLFPSDEGPTMYFCHLASCPAPKTISSSSLIQPTIPLGGLPPGTPGIGAFHVGDAAWPAWPRPLGRHIAGSSPISKYAEAKEYVSEKIRGMRGSFANMPHFC